MKVALKILLAVSFALWAGLLAAQELEVIELKSRTVEQVMPALRPLLEPGATLSGMNNQLFLRASVGNRAQIRQALAAIDKPARQLIIRVSQNRQVDNSQRGATASGQVVLGSNRRANVDATVWDSRSASRDSVGQMVRTIEGGQAYIEVGRTLPVPMRQVIIGPGGAVINETTAYRDIGQGFYAVPRLNGNRVTLDISQKADRADSYGHGGSTTQRLSTTVSGSLGEWIELGGTGQQLEDSRSGSLNLSTRDLRGQRSIWLKVEEVD
jgi:type II secretory pathway component GspD/PulD (secretin)